MIKVIFFDIDNTLLSHTTRKVPIETEKALNTLHKKGIFIFLCTGRHISEIKDLPLDDLYYDGVISLNGQYCYNDKEVIYDLPINHQDISAVVDYIDKHPFPCIFVEDKLMYINFNNDIVQSVQNDISTSLPPVNDIHRGFTRPIYQVIPYGINDEQEILTFMPHCKATWWHPKAFDIIPITGGKQNGIKHVLDYYHLNQAETMAFGDGYNDIPMFDYCALSVAMGNASDQVKQKANYITEDVDHHGIFNALKHYKLI